MEENTTIIEDLIISLDDESGNIDLTTSFPNNFFINFTEYDTEYNLIFVKVASSAKQQPSNNIYTLDKDGNPVKFNIIDEDVSSLFYIYILPKLK